MAQDSKEIVEFYARGHGINETGRRFGISGSRVQQILKRDHPEVLREKGTGRQTRQQISLAPISLGDR